ncbi:DMT family transporter [Salinicoccus hispanicus]|uniref:QacE family quaternary ammonium compound efflux SMR transporter n=1 Tax=Salinicoccus hispanicus TaxID=157225 RepID=A0A6N8U1R6_9STAP|nr:multidrug efflux SMR transporter [Salinicoccus hispanicus]MXQ51722.1 QacE family quaternary ammonium compound efflux SMR transporter [Salinicoccus hispanicus]
MAWISLVLAGLFEVCGVLSINKLHKDKSLFSLLLLLVCFGLSFSFLAIALEVLPMGTAYAIWTGIGASGGALLGMVFFGESKDWKRIFFILLIICAVVGLKLIS